MRNKYEIRGDVIAIFLNRRDGQVLETLIDAEDFDLINIPGVSWYARWCRCTNSYYVSGCIAGQRGKRLNLHRVLMGLSGPKDRHIYVDHIFHDTLDNRRSVNLILSNHAQNGQNSKEEARASSKSKIKNVRYDKRDDNYEAYVDVDGKRLVFGSYKNIKEAELIAKAARAKYLPYSLEAIKYKHLIHLVPELKYFNGKKVCNGSISGVPMLYPTKSGKWMTFVRVKGKHISLGTHTNKEDAIKARLDALENFKYGLSCPFPCPDARV